MSYKDFKELKQLPKDEAKRIYKAAYSQFKTAEKGTYFKLKLIVSLGAVLGVSIGLYFANETHLGAYLAGVGALIGHYFMTKRVEKRMKPYVLGLVNEASTKK